MTRLGNRFELLFDLLCNAKCKNFFSLAPYQRFYVNDEFFKVNGPIFLMIGGEGEATAKWMKKGAWIHYAEEFGALCFQLEHRFYGKSHPTE
jgi:Serine carboxypeptidase S28